MDSSPVQDGARYAAVRQYSLAQILGVWAAAAVPMGVLAWVVAPWLRDQLGGDEPFARGAADLPHRGAHLAVRAGPDPDQAGAGGTRMVARARRPLAAVAPRSEDRHAWAEGSGGGCCSSPSSSPSGRRCRRSQGPRSGISAISSAPTAARISSAARGAGSRWSSCSPSSTPCSARSCSSGGCCCRECRASSEGATGSPTGRCSRSTTCISRGAFPPPWWTDLPSRLSLAAVPERVDGDHRALGPERLLHHRRPHHRRRSAVLLRGTRLSERSGRAGRRLPPQDEQDGADEKAQADLAKGRHVPGSR